MIADQNSIESAQAEALHLTRDDSTRDWFAALPAARRSVVATLLVAWIALIAVLGLRLAIEVFAGPRIVYIWPDIATPEGLMGAALVYLVCSAAAVFTRWLRPTAVLPVTIVVGASIFLAGALVTGAAGALTLIVTGGIVATLIGWLLLYRLPYHGAPPLVHATVAIAVGLGGLGLLFFGLGSFGVLTTPAVLGCASLLTLGLVVVQRPRPDFHRVRSWQPQRLSWFETLIVGLTVGLLTFASLIALVPETISDAVWQQLPIAREVWQTGTVGEFAHLEVSKDPIQAHVLYAVAYGLGGLSSTMLLHTLVGLAGVGGIAALGLLLSGRKAAISSAAVFASIPLTLWLMGHALIDFFTVLFAVSALVCVVLWQRTGDVRWSLVAGALTGVGLGTKLNMLPLFAIMGVALFLVGRQVGHWRERFLACIAFGCGALVALPWILRSVLSNGTLSPKIQVVINALAARFSGTSGTAGAVRSTPVTDALQVYDPQAFALGQSPFALLRIPWFFTFHADEHRFLVIGRGEIGILLLMLIPVVMFITRSRSSALIALTAILSYVAWALTPFQIIRHLLPTFALVAVLIGTAVGGVLEHEDTRARRALGGVVRGGLLIGLAVAPVFFLFGVLTQVPVDYLLGRESAAAYVQRSVPAAVALEAASALAPDMPVAYFGRQDGGAQIYSEARLIYVEPNHSLASLGTSPDEVLTSLEALGVDHFIWNRTATTPDDWRATVLSLPFLRDHTRIIAGDRNAYLFAIVPAGSAAWEENPKSNLLADPELNEIKKGSDSWVATGTVKGSRGAPTVRSDSLIAQRVPVSPEQPYLLVIEAKCQNSAGSVSLAIRWFDENDHEVGRELETVVPGTGGSEQFLWHHAPKTAASASVELTTTRGTKPCNFDSAALYAEP